MDFERLLKKVDQAVSHEQKGGKKACARFERSMFIYCMVEAEAAAEKGDHLAHRLVVRMGAMAPHLINAGV